jgi:hypothetical protein
LLNSDDHQVAAGDIEQFVSFAAPFRLLPHGHRALRAGIGGLTRKPSDVDSGASRLIRHVGQPLSVSRELGVALIGGHAKHLKPLGSPGWQRPQLESILIRAEAIQNEPSVARDIVGSFRGR